MLGVLALVTNLLSLGVPAGQAAPPSDAQKLFESGRYEALLTRVEDAEEPAPESRYLAGHSALKMKPPDPSRAVSLFRGLGGAEDDPWTFIGRSAAAAAEHQAEAAVAAARQAVTLAPSLLFAQYQLGLAYAEARNWPGALEAFEKAATIQPTFAYAHYGAGMASYQVKRVDRMAIAFERFLKLAPDAPERPAVEALMRTIRR